MASTPRTLVLIRHAKSAWPQDVPDQERYLAPRGRRDAPAIGRWLRRNLPSIDLLVCSPAVRTRETWELASAQLDTVPPTREDGRLYGATIDDLLAVTRELPAGASTVVLLGHNPVLDELLELMSGAVHHLKTSTIAVMRSTVDTPEWALAGPGSWRLETLELPRGD